jgi:hypothetical protein
MGTLEVGHRYVAVYLGLVSPSLSGRTIDAFVIYSTGEASPAPWVIEAILSTDVKALNSSADELARLEAAGVEMVRVPASVFQGDMGVPEVVLAPFFYGFHVGLEIPEDAVNRMLTVIEANADELARSDAAFRQIRDGMLYPRLGAVAALVLEYTRRRYFALFVLVVLVYMVPALGIFVATGHVAWSYLLVLAAGSMAGAWLAVQVTLGPSGTILVQRFTLAVIAVIIVKLLIDLI